MDNFYWDSQQSYRVGDECYQIERKAMLSNIISNPVVESSTKLNRIFRPLHIALSKPHISNHTPELIIYLGTMSIHLYMYYNNM